jgi:hypothetical protein
MLDSQPGFYTIDPFSRLGPIDGFQYSLQRLLRPINRLIQRLDGMCILSAAQCDG